MIGSFKEGLIEMNEARKSLGLDEIKEAFHDIYFEKEKILEFIKKI